MMAKSEMIDVETGCNTNMMDSIQYAAQIGRLDFVTVVLAAVTVTLATGGVIAFFNIKSNAKKIAEKVAEQHSKEVAERVANEYMQKNLPDIIQAYDQLGKNSAERDVSNEIAEVSELGGE